MSEYYKQLVKDMVETEVESSSNLDEYRETYKKFRQSLLMKIHHLEYELGESNQDLKHIIEKLSMKKSEKSGNLWCWITISPDPKKFKSALDVVELVNHTIKKCNRKLIEDWKFCVEQRTDNITEFDKKYPNVGIHLHLLCRRNLAYKPSKFCKNFRNSWKMWVKNVNDNNFVNMKWCPQEYLRDKLEYMEGVKTGVGKDKKCMCDSYMRKSKGMLSLYTKFLEN